MTLSDKLRESADEMRIVLDCQANLVRVKISYEKCEVAVQRMEEAAAVIEELTYVMKEAER